MGVEVGAVGSLGWFWLGAAGMAKSLPFMGREVVSGVGPREFARGDFGATVGRAASLLALSFAPLPKEGNREVWAGWLCRGVAVDDGSKGKTGQRCHPHGCH